MQILFVVLTFEGNGISCFAAGSSGDASISKLKNSTADIFSFRPSFSSDSSGMWDEDEGGGDDDEEEEDEALAGQLLSDLISSKKYGTNASPVNYRRTFVSGHLSFLV